MQKKINSLVVTSLSTLFFLQLLKICKDYAGFDTIEVIDHYITSARVKGPF